MYIHVGFELLSFINKQSTPDQTAASDQPESLQCLH